MLRVRFIESPWALPAAITEPLSCFFQRERIHLTDALPLSHQGDGPRLS